jgi:dTDP-4-dehydrorhamnose reductase
MSEKILLLGSKGQVGGAWLKTSKAEAVVAWSRENIDLQNISEVKRQLAMLPKDVKGVVNCAAYTQVDKAEIAREAAAILNVDLPRILAEWCADRDIPLLHYSTDYVFDGHGTQFFEEDAATHPMNWYGETKRQGELAIQSSRAKHLVLRTSWVFDFSARNFLSSILKLAKEREILEVVDDQVGAPTYATDLAQVSAQAFERAYAPPVYPSGIYHLCHKGAVSRYDFACAIIEQVRARGIALKVKEMRRTNTLKFTTPAKRPLNSRMSTDKIEKVLGVALPTWQEGLEHCLQREL